MKKNYKTPSVKLRAAMSKTAMLAISEKHTMGIYGSERQMNASSALSKERDDFGDDVDW